jgi:hypothetical protein
MKNDLKESGSPSLPLAAKPRTFSSPVLTSIWCPQLIWIRITRWWPEVMRFCLIQWNLTILSFTWFPQYFMAVPCSYLHSFWTQDIFHHVLQCTSNTFGSKPHTYEFVFKFSQDPYLQKRTRSIWCDIKKVRTAKDLTTIPTMMFASVKGMELFITLKTVVNILVRNPFLTWAKWSLDNFANLVIHKLTISIKEKLLNEWINE